MSEINNGEMMYRVLDEREEVMEDGTKERIVYVELKQNNPEPAKKQLRKVKVYGKHGCKPGLIPSAKRKYKTLNERFEESGPLTKVVVTGVLGGLLGLGVTAACKGTASVVSGIRNGWSTTDPTKALPEATAIEVDPIIT